MISKNETEIKNRFSSLGENWKINKEKILDTINEFNDDVFYNF